MMSAVFSVASTSPTTQTFQITDYMQLPKCPDKFTKCKLHILECFSNTKYKILVCQILFSTAGIWQWIKYTSGYLLPSLHIMRWMCQLGWHASDDVVADRNTNWLVVYLHQECQTLAEIAAVRQWIAIERSFWSRRTVRMKAQHDTNQQLHEKAFWSVYANILCPSAVNT